MTWIEAVPPWVAALPWLALLSLLYWRIRQSRSLNEYEPIRGRRVPRVSVIIPARDEALNIGRCVSSLLLTTYADVEFIVVDDHSADGTADVAWRAIGGDARARVTNAPPLPAGWFGKQWACAHGASLATGELLLFTDADTWHAPDCLARSVSALEARSADALTIIGVQEAVTFWEKVGQPAVFLGIFAMMGSTESLSNTKNPRRKAANGQYLLLRRDVYEALGGHEVVRTYVAEDIMIAQTWTRAGRVVHALMALDQFSTRMYRSLGELVRGWRKNVWAGGKYFLHDHPVSRAVGRVVVPLTPLGGVIPGVALLLGAIGVLSPWWTAFGVFGSIYEVVMLAAIYHRVRLPLVCVLLYPLGALLAAYVFAAASIRGNRTEWKGREYRVA